MIIILLIYVGLFAPCNRDVNLRVAMVLVVVEQRHDLVDTMDQLDDNVFPSRHAQSVKATRAGSIDVRDDVIRDDDLKGRVLQKLLMQTVQEDFPLVVAQGKTVRQ